MTGPMVRSGSYACWWRADSCSNPCRILGRFRSCEMVLEPPPGRRCWLGCLRAIQGWRVWYVGHCMFLGECRCPVRDPLTETTP